MVYSAEAKRRFMRLRFPNEQTADTNHRLGGIVAGTKHEITVPMEWSFDDNEQPNISRHRTRSAVSWAYVEGPPQRTIQGRLVGDVNRFRMKLRNLIRQTTRYEFRPLGLVIDGDRLVDPESVFYGRFVSGSSLDNAGWYKDSANVWRSAGDLSLKLEEEV